MNPSPETPDPKPPQTPAYEPPKVELIGNLRDTVAKTGTLPDTPGPNPVRP